MAALGPWTYLYWLGLGAKATRHTTDQVAGV
jgi:hypothetical protein